MTVLQKAHHLVSRCSDLLTPSPTNHLQRKCCVNSLLMLCSSAGPLRFLISWNNQREEVVFFFCFTLDYNRNDYGPYQLQNMVFHVDLCFEVLRIGSTVLIQELLQKCESKKSGAQKGEKLFSVNLVKCSHIFYLFFKVIGRFASMKWRKMCL